MQYTTTPTNNAFYNGLYNNSNCRFDIAYATNGNFRLNIGNQSAFEPKKGDLSRHIFVLDVSKKRVEIDEDIYECSFNFTNATTGAIKIGNRYDPSVSYPCWEKIYSSKIYIDDILVQYLIPCYRIADNEVGMYDLVENKFYNNNGSNLFICGPKIEKDEKDIVRVEYIETTGTQFIDTGVLPTTTTRWELYMQYTTTPTSNAFYNGLYNNSNCRFDIAYATNGNFRLNIGNQSAFEPKKGDLSRHIFVLDVPRKRVEIDENTYECSFNFTNATKGAIKIGNRYDPSVSYPCQERIYGSKIYKDNVLVQELIPCYYINQAGMYDLIGKEFYENSGTGTFLYGPEV